MSEKKIYVTSGNLPLIELIKNTPKLILDIGCGAGNNAELIRSRYPESIIEGVTYSEAERNIAVQIMNKVLVFDIEGDIIDILEGKILKINNKYIHQILTDIVNSDVYANLSKKSDKADDCDIYLKKIQSESDLVWQAVCRTPPSSSSFLNISTPVTTVLRVSLKPTISISSPTLQMPCSIRPVTTVPRP